MTFCLCFNCRTLRPRPGLRQSARSAENQPTDEPINKPIDQSLRQYQCFVLFCFLVFGGIRGGAGFRFFFSSNTSSAAGPWRVKRRPLLTLTLTLSLYLSTVMGSIQTTKRHCTCSSFSCTMPVRTAWALIGTRHPPANQPSTTKAWAARLCSAERSRTTRVSRAPRMKCLLCSDGQEEKEKK